MKHGDFKQLLLPNGVVLPLVYRVEEETPGLTKWRVHDASGESPDFIVTLFGATRSKMEELHHRKLKEEDIRIGMVKAILRGQEHLRSRLEEGEEAPAVEEVAMRDTDLAELTDSKTVRVSGVPY